MSKKGRIDVARFGRKAMVLLAVIGCWPLVHAQAGESDLLSVDTDHTLVEGKLDNSSQRKADAITHYVMALFEEESDGPEKALEEKRQVLLLDPAFTALAVEVSYEYLRRGDSTEAISVLKDAVKAAPKDPAPALALSSIYLKHLKKPELAAKYAQLALDVAPNNFSSYSAMWETYEAMGMADRAAQLLDRAAKVKNTDASFWLSLAELRGRNLLRTNGRLTPDEAAAVFGMLEKAGQYGSKNADTLSKIGDFYVLAQQLKKAIPYYQKVIILRPDFPLIRERLAGCYVETDQTAEGIKQIEEIVKTNPLNIKAYDKLYELYLKAGNLEKALSNAQQGLLIEPSAAERHLFVVQLLLQLGKYQQAADYLADARRRFPDAAIFTYYHGIALSETKHHEEAMKAFEEALVEAGNTHPQMLDSDFYFKYGAAAEQAGHYVKAAELFRKSIDLDPTSAARSYNYLAYMWIEQNQNLAEAESLLRRALEMEPDNGAYIDSLGWLYFKQAKYDDALTALLRASSSLPEPDAVVYGHIADTYEKLGKKSEAVLYWQKSLQLDPTNKEVTAKLDQAAEKVVQQPAGKSPESAQNPPH